ncbi:vgr related protein [Sphingomonas turrisvirgatae]|uniref:Vgr related protein n=1 Tax=Sphingomonas turrisvirgatae TaxID=1888892 RepID=A0A1E3M0E4_9SPHN|nr:vgr related protein [Sphingomonas turrisvirgatae]ODP39451.1 vgr related protein [Sphingomonas turrisvirgatae]
MKHRRALTQGEITLARTMFGDAIDYARASIANRKWIFFQPRTVTMAPLGCIHFHPGGGSYREDFATAGLDLQGLFIHEMVHIWQHQQGIFLPIRRHPFCRYGYSLKPGWTLRRYGLEQQAEIVRHVFLLRNGALLPGAPPLEQYRGVLPFSGVDERSA